MRNIALEIAYDGKRYSGWQIQNNAITIQGVLEDVLKTILKVHIRLKAAGRTDAGVHALGQVASFNTESQMTPEQFKIAINSLLPDDIRIMNTFEASFDFNPRYGASKRWYRYLINNNQNLIPFFRNYSLWIRREINIDMLNNYCNRIIGDHDFTGFSSIKEGEMPMRRVYDCNVKCKRDFIIFDITANSFLRKMVRTIIGTFLDFEKNREMPEKVDEILHRKDRRKAGPTAYPGGLYLVKVFY